jgi:hypothetical protein
MAYTSLVMRSPRRFQAVLLAALLSPGPGACAMSWTGPPDTGTDTPADDPSDAPVEPDPETGCPSGWKDCGGVCLDIRNDVNNCGDCAVACPPALHADPVCMSSECGTVCQAGWSDPDGDGACDVACTPVDETCNGIDDDCNGACDDGVGMACCSGTTGPCTTSCGSPGQRTCTASCVWNTCQPPAETCNGIDDDCDTVCDNGFGCCAGSTESCTLPCGSSGTRTCSPSCAWGTCETAAETCNGIDDDCDTVCDNGFGCCRGASESCTTSCGSTGTRTCSSSCGWGSCDAPAEACNGDDEDCDGEIDEGFRTQVMTSVPYASLSVYNATCNGTAERWGLACNDAIHLYCSAIDCPQSGFGPVENYDSNLDLVCTAGGEVFSTSYPALAAYHAECTSANPISGACFAAINRYCQAAGYVSGFGPVSSSGGTVRFTCVRGAERRNTTYTTLASYHGVCDGVTEGIGPDCYAAVKRYCNAEGFASGFGPVEMSGDNCTVVCVNP